MSDKIMAQVVNPEEDSDEQTSIFEMDGFPSPINVESNIIRERNSAHDIPEASVHTVPAVEERVIIDPQNSDFPLWIFPAEISSFIEEGVSTLGFHPDYLSMAVISATAASFGNCYHVKVREQHTEPAMFWIVIVGEPGVNKTHPINLALKPIMAMDAKRGQEYQELLTEYKSKKKGGAGNSPISIPQVQCTIISDFTMEAVISVHNDNSKGLLVHADEILSWTQNQNRYNGGNDQGQWNSIWSGSPISMIRKKSEPLFLQKPYVNIIGTIQPGAIPSLLTRTMMNTGSFERMIFVFPDTEASPWEEREFDTGKMEIWTQYLNDLLEIPFHGIPRQIPFTVEAKQRLLEWQRNNTIAINSIDDPIFSSQLSKWQSVLVRNALVLQVMHSTCRKEQIVEIELSNLEGAIALNNHLQPYSIKVLNYLKQDPRFNRLSSWKKKMYGDLSAEFETNEALCMGKKSGKSERSVYDFLKDASLFSKVSHGWYRKKK